MAAGCAEAVVVALLLAVIAGVVAAPFVAGWLVGRDRGSAAPAATAAASARPAAAGWAAASADGPLLVFPSDGEAVLLGPDGGPAGSGCRLSAPIPATRLTLVSRTAYRIAGHAGAVACRAGEPAAGMLLEFAVPPPTGPVPGSPGR